jgi:hypothetical protein
VLAGAGERAVTADVDVRGPWAFETAGSTPDWEARIVELAKDHGSERAAREVTGVGDQ